MEMLKNKDGAYFIQNKAFKDIARAACLKVKNIAPAKKDNDFIDIEIDKNNNLFINVNIKTKQGADVNKICLDIQEEINDSIYLMTGINCKNIDVHILGFITDKKTK